MTRNETLARFSRIGLILAAFAIVTAVVAQPLWDRLWPSAITMTDSGQSRVQ
jgi:hypothetical protein